MGVGAQHCPPGLHALWGLRAAGVLGGRSWGGWPATVARGVWCQALSLPRPPVLWSGQPGFRYPCVLGAVGAGVGTQHRPHAGGPAEGIIVEPSGMVLVLAADMVRGVLHASRVRRARPQWAIQVYTPPRAWPLSTWTKKKHPHGSIATKMKGYLFEEAFPKRNVTKIFDNSTS